MRAFCSWSGGKESALALAKGRRQGINVSFLLNMVSENGKHSRSHGVTAGLLRKQAGCLNIPLVQAGTSWQDYEAVFKSTVAGMADIKAGVFGDIDLQEHRDWVERICLDLGLEPVLPLWGEKREDILRQFIKAGFQAIVVAAEASSLGEEWLGRLINEEFIRDLKSLANIDLCGEKGEYHTFVFNGPLFSRPVKIAIGEKVLRDNHWFLEIY